MLTSGIGKQTVQVILAPDKRYVDVATLHCLTIHLDHTGFVSHGLSYGIRGSRKNPLGTAKTNLNGSSLYIFYIYIERLHAFL